MSYWLIVLGVAVVVASILPLLLGYPKLSIDESRASMRAIILVMGALIGVSLLFEGLQARDYLLR